MKKTQTDIAKRLIKIRDIMDFIDDGHHLEDYCNLVKISNMLFEQLTPANQQKFQEWCTKKFWEVHGE